MSEYARTLIELKKNAVLFWPRDVLEKEAAVSVLPLLLKTQDKFISLLHLSDAGPESWMRLVDHSEEMRGNIFLKHLMVLTDLAGEALNKLTPFGKFFDDGVMNYVWREKNYSYQFGETVKKTTLTNIALRVDGKSLLKGYALSPKMQDVAMLLIHGASAHGDSFPEDAKEKCMIGSLIGESALLNDFVKQSYIRVSTQLRGASSNAMGQIAQKYVAEILTDELKGWSIKSGHVPGISHDDGSTETTFDVVAKSPNGKYFAIEVSFQFTTNSVIERKSGQAQARAKLLHEHGHYICYVIDGAGNINVRERAVSIICQFSDCTVAFSKDEKVVKLPDFVSGMAKEGKGIRLVRSLEESRGCTLTVAGRRTGFNGLSVCNGEVVRKIELKTVENSDDWFAINGLYGIESLFFDARYYLYFALLREQKILVASGITFLQAQIPGYKSDVGNDMKEWISLTKEIGTKAGLNIIPRVNFKLKLGIYSLVQALEAEQKASPWSIAVDSIWHLKELNSWQQTYPL